MEIILLQKVHNLGNMGDTVTVRNGYGRNFLLPKEKAVRATRENVAKFAARRAELEKIAAEQLAAAQQRAERIKALTVTIVSKAGEGGKLYGSIGTRDIAHAITQQGEEVRKSEVRLAEGPIRLAGAHDIDLQLHADVIVTVKINIVAES